jgi:hypothetical protein
MNKGLTSVVKAERRQQCTLHAMKYLPLTLWGEGVGKDDRVDVVRAVKQAFFIQVNSTKKHLEDGDKAELKTRIDMTLRELYSIADYLIDHGYPKATTFIEKYTRFTITFPELAVERINIPYTTNAIDRLMGEISKRCKHKWMH